MLERQTRQNLIRFGYLREFVGGGGIVGVVVGAGEADLRFEDGEVQLGGFISELRGFLFYILRMDFFIQKL